MFNNAFLKTIRNYITYRAESACQLRLSKNHPQSAYIELLIPHGPQIINRQMKQADITASYRLIVRVVIQLCPQPFIYKVFVFVFFFSTESAGATMTSS